MDKFDRVFWKRWWSLAKPYWVSEQRRQALVLLGVLVVLTLFSIGIGAELSFLWRNVTNSLAARDYVAFRKNIVFIVGVFIVFIPVSAFYPWFSNRLLILWREWMTHRFIALEFANRAYYRIGQKGRIDNPDQRISEDIRDFTGGALGYVDIFATSIVNGAVFFVILWTISPLLALISVAYSGIGTVISVKVGRPLIPINFDQQRYEADFRFALVHVRDNSESIAMYGGEQQEAKQLFARFASVFRNYNLLILWQRRLAYVTSTYGNAITLLPYLALASAYFAHKIEMGQFFQAAGAFGTVKDSLSVIVDFLQGFTGYAAVANRLATFSEECEAVAIAPTGGERIETVEADRLALDSVTLRTPDERQTLMRDLSFEVERGRGLLLRGPSGAGKTSILRAIAGLWDSGRGRIERPELSQMMFLPQKPYMVLGTLRDQLCYPRAAVSDDDELRRVLTAVNLGDLAQRAGGFDIESDWTDMLSPGEQQRLSFARLMLNRPRYALLDEATGALDRANEAGLYQLLRSMKITFISVSHNESVAEYHQQFIELERDGSWKQSAARDSLTK
jgi:putative ATP-binding cassette transporter